MKSIILVLTVLIVNLSYGQCKFKVDRVRKVNGDTIITTRDLAIYSDEKGSYSITFHKKNSDYYLAFKKASNSKETLTVKEGMKLILSMSNGEKMELYTTADFETDLLYSAGDNSVLIARYPLNKDNLKLFSENSVSECKFQTTQSTWDVKPKNKKKILKVQEGAGCILSR